MREHARLARSRPRDDEIGPSGADAPRWTGLGEQRARRVGVEPVSSRTRPRVFDAPGSVRRASGRSSSSVVGPARATRRLGGSGFSATVNDRTSRSRGRSSATVSSANDDGSTPAAGAKRISSVSNSQVLWAESMRGRQGTLPRPRRLSRSSVTGPSFTSSTCMSARITPMATVAPRSPATGVDQGLGLLGRAASAHDGRAARCRRTG